MKKRLRPPSSKNSLNYSEESIMERRLRPVYDALDCRNNKNALQQIDKVLKKHPKLPCCLALKALALIRLGRTEDCESILCLIKQSQVMDQGALQALTLVYIEMERPLEICSAYETALKSDPNNEELLSSLFMAHVRVNSYKKQQQVALTLFKTQDKTPYFFWAIMSVVMQAIHENDGAKSQTLTLPLAQRMMQLMENDAKIGQEQEIQLYLLILEMQEKYSEALNLLRSKLGNKLSSGGRHYNLLRQKKVEYMAKLKMWESVVIETKIGLSQNADQWDMYRWLIDATFSLSPENNKLPPDETLKELAAYIDSLISSNSFMRGPYLARLLFHSRICSNSGGGTDQFLTFLYEYFIKFASKSICFSDMILFIVYLSESQKRTLLNKVHDVIVLNNEGSPGSLADIQKHVTWYKLQRFLGYHHRIIDDDSSSNLADLKKSLVKELSQHFGACQSLVQHIPSAEQRPSDTYILLLSHILWELWSEHKDEEVFLWTALKKLHIALNKSPSNYNLRFVLIRYLAQIGAIGFAYNIYLGLEVKYIQHDSLCHVISEQLYTCGHFEKVALVWDNALKFYSHVDHETTEHIMAAYRFGTFRKISEFVTMRERLEHSQNHVLVSIERVLLDLLISTSSYSDVVDKLTSKSITNTKQNSPFGEFDWSLLYDNRDFDVMQSFDPASVNDLNQEVIAENRLNVQTFIRLRNLMVRCLSTSVSMSEDFSGTKSVEEIDERLSTLNINGEHKASLLEFLITKYKSLVSSFEGPCTTSNSIQVPDRSKYRLVAYIDKGRNSDLFVSLFNLVVSLVSFDKDAEDSRCKQLLLEISDSLANIVETRNSDITDRPDKLFYRSTLLESFVVSLESFSLTCIVFSICHRIILSNVAGSRKNKKINSSNIIVALNSTVNNVLLSLEAFRSILRKFQDVTKVENDIHCIESEDVGEEIRMQIQWSYEVSFAELYKVIDQKIAFFNQLKS